MEIIFQERAWQNPVLSVTDPIHTSQTGPQLAIHQTTEDFMLRVMSFHPVISNDECASNCHGTDFSGGGSTVSCDSCHDEGVFPHFDQGQILWNLTGHQNAVNITLGNDTVCTECHSDYLRGPDGGALITCTTYCH